jgi:hypothetical protein
MTGSSAPSADQLCRLVSDIRHGQPAYLREPTTEIARRCISKQHVRLFPADDQVGALLPWSPSTSTRDFLVTGRHLAR